MARERAPQDVHHEDRVRVMVDIAQFLARKMQVSMPPGMRAWPDEQGNQPRDGSWGYVDLPTRRCHVYHGDWIVYEGGKPVGHSRTQPLPQQDEFCALCGNTWNDHFNIDNQPTTTCGGFERLPKPVREILYRGREDKAVLDWLEENTAYVMLGANVDKQRFNARTLESGGNGWRDGAMRRAVKAQIDLDNA